MKLNGVTIENMAIGNASFTDSYEFIKALKNTKNMLADVYIDGHRVGSSGVIFTEENGWLGGCVNFSFSLSAPLLTSSILIKVYQAGHKDVITMSTMTMTKEYIEVGDQTASLYFTIISVNPYNDKRRPSRESVISWSRTKLLPAAVLKDLPTDDSVEEVQEDDQNNDQIDTHIDDPTDDPIDTQIDDPTDDQTDDPTDDPTDQADDPTDDQLDDPTDNPPDNPVDDLND